MTLRNTDGKYMTRNIYLSAFLKTCNYDIVLKKEVTGRFTFWIKIDDEMEELVNHFYANEASVEPIEYSIALKEIKRQMYE